MSLTTTGGKADPSLHGKDPIGERLATVLGGEAVPRIIKTSELSRLVKLYYRHWKA